MLEGHVGRDGPQESVGLFSVGRYLVSVTGTAILFTWVFNNTRGSVLLAVVLHLMTNASGRIIFPMFPELGPDAIDRVVSASILVKWLLVLVVIGRFGRERLSRQPLDPACRS